MSCSPALEFHHVEGSTDGSGTNAFAERISLSTPLEEAVRRIKIAIIGDCHRQRNEERN
jgi:hypothetical protein